MPPSLHSSLFVGHSLPPMAPPLPYMSTSDQPLHERLPSQPSLDSIDLTAQLLHLQQQQQLLRHLTHTNNPSSTTLTQQQPLQHTMSVADPFVPSWALYSPPSPLDKLSPPGGLVPSLPSRVDSFPPPLSAVLLSRLTRRSSTPGSCCST